MKRMIALAVSRRKIAAVVSPGVVAAVVDLRLEPADERDERGALRDEELRGIDRRRARSRTTFSRKTERMSRTCSTGAASQARTSLFPLAVAAKTTRCGPRPPRSIPVEPDQLGPLEPVEAVVDDRAADRPDLAELAAGAELVRERPAVGRLLGDERQHGPVVGRHRTSSPGVYSSCRN